MTPPDLLKRLGPWLVPGAAVFLGLLAAWRILISPYGPDIDQRFIEYVFSFGQWPHFDRGISSDLIAGIYNLFDSYEPVSSNGRIRTIAMALYMGSGVLLFNSLTRNQRPLLGLMCILLLFTTRYPFLWLSSEMFAGAFIMLALWSLVTEKPIWLIGICLALYGTAKPDLVLSAGAVGLYAVIRVSNTWKEGIIKAAQVGAPTLVLYLPGLAQYGMGFFEHSFYLRPEDQASSRAFYSIGQHYAAMMFDHQLLPEAQRPSQWFAWKDWVHQIWGSDVNSVKDMILRSPTRYLDYLFMSASESLLNSVKSFAAMLFPLTGYALWKSEDRHMKWVFGLLMVVSLIPVIALAYLHVRYIARYYPLVLFPAYVFLAREASPKVYRLALVGLCLLLGLQAVASLGVLKAGWWFVH